MGTIATSQPFQFSQMGRITFCACFKALKFQNVFRPRTYEDYAEKRVWSFELLNYLACVFTSTIKNHFFSYGIFIIVLFLFYFAVFLSSNSQSLRSFWPAPETLTKRSAGSGNETEQQLMFRSCAEPCSSNTTTTKYSNSFFNYLFHS